MILSPTHGLSGIRGHCVGTGQQYIVTFVQVTTTSCGPVNK